MRYAEPKILKSCRAISLIQQVGSPWNSEKTCDIFLDAAIPYPAFCTPNAYEADE